MHVQASSRALAPISSVGDAVPFEVACFLSSILVVAAGIRVYGCFQPPKRRPSQFAIACIILVSCTSFLGLVSSKACGIFSLPYLLALELTDKEEHQGVCLGFLLWNSWLSGICEADHLFLLLGGVSIALKVGVSARKVGVWLVAPTCLLMAVGGVGVITKSHNPRSIWIILLFAASGILYILLCIGYIILVLSASTKKTFLSVLGAPCFFILIPVAFLCMSLTGLVRGLFISAWTFFTMSGLSTVRMQIIKPLGIYKQLSRSNQTGLRRQPHVQLGSISNPSSSTSLWSNASTFPSNLPSSSGPPNYEQPQRYWPKENGLDELDEEAGRSFRTDSSRQGSMVTLTAPAAARPK